MEWALERYVGEMIGVWARRLGLFALGVSWGGALVGCASGGRVEAASSRTPTDAERRSGETAVGALLDRFHAAAAAADEAAYFGCLLDESIFLGTDATERWDKRAFLAYARPHFSKGKGWTYRSTERHVQLIAGGAAAVFDELLAHDRYGVMRGSGAAVLRDGRWYVLSYDLSKPIPNDRFDVALAAMEADVVTADGGPLADLAWLAGAYVVREGDVITEEVWLAPAGGLMVGTGRSAGAGHAPFFEWLRIEARADGVVLVASPRGGASTEFRLTKPEKGKAVFENPTHDDPKRIVYEATAGGLVVTVEGKSIRRTTMRRAVTSTKAK